MITRIGGSIQSVTIESFQVKVRDDGSVVGTVAAVVRKHDQAPGGRLFFVPGGDNS